MAPAPTSHDTKEQVPLIPLKSPQQTTSLPATAANFLHRHTAPKSDSTETEDRRNASYAELPQRDSDDRDERMYPSKNAYSTVHRGSLSGGEGTNGKATKGFSWLPYALQWPWMALTISSGISLLIVVVALHSCSVKSSGLADDSGATSLYFGWRFAPTMLAVLFVTMLMVLLDAVKRTEPFARLSSNTNSTADATILRSPGPWWTTLVDSFPRKANDHHFSPTMMCATIAYLVGLLVLSPFSAALLAPKNVALSEARSFKRVRLGSGSTVEPRLDTVEYLHTIGHMLQNVTTSPWISDEYSVLPFWPIEIDRPSGSRFPDLRETWEAESLVFQSDLVCEDLKLTSGPLMMNYTHYVEYYFENKTLNTNFTMSQDLVSLLLETDSGCKFGFSYPRFDSIDSYPGSVFWTDVARMNVESMSSGCIYTNECKSAQKSQLLNHTSECTPGEVMFMMTANSTNPRTKIAGQLCRPHFYVATLPVTVSIDNTATVFTFDEASFLQARSPIGYDIANISTFQSEFLNSTWDAHLKSVSKFAQTRPLLGGPARLLAAQYGFNASEVLRDTGMIEKASRLKQRAFGQALLSSLDGISTTAQIDGRVFTVRRRIVVNEAVALTLEVVLGSIVCLLVVVFWFSRSHRRPLGLAEDPAFTNTVASLIATQEKTKAILQSVPGAVSQQLSTELSHLRFKVATGLLQNSADNSKSEEAVPHKHVASNIDSEARWRPMMLSTPMTGLLTIVLGIFIVAMAVLFYHSQKYGLFGSFMTQVTIGNEEDPLARFAPYSVIPTLLAVLIGLWWGALETVFRMAQPFVAMAERPTTSARGSGLSYQSSYLAWAATRAIHRKHWLLGLVCIGASLSQIFTVTMSAIWQRETDLKFDSIEVARTLQLREVPHLSSGDSYKGSGFKTIIVGTTFENLTTNWMYSATLQLSLNASEPVWSKDGWSFVPVTTWNATHNNKNRVRKNGSDSLQSGSKVSVDVPAIRARMDCSALGQQLDQSNWLTRQNMTDGIWNQTDLTKAWKQGYTIGCSSDRYGSPINFRLNTSSLDPCEPLDWYTSLLPAGFPEKCCTGSSDLRPGFASVGYWSPIHHVRYEDTRNFTIKWVHGSSPEKFPTNTTTDVIVWPEPPKMSILTCKPLIEAANASIVLDPFTDRVENYTIKDEPKPYALAWADHFKQSRHPDHPNKYDYTYNYTTSFGHIFVESLLNAAQLDMIGGCQGSLGGHYKCEEKSTDETFNIKRPGLNLDYMSYAMLSQSGNNPEALLDHTVLEDAAQKTFTTFFQHFASSNVNLYQLGNRVFQLPDETLPSDVPRPSNDNTVSAPSKASPMHDPKATLTISTEIETLRMSAFAVWTCIAILAWLIVTSILILVYKHRYFSPLLRGVDTLADVAIMLASSDRFLSLAQQKGASGLRADKTFRTRLGWFRSKDARHDDIHWGIELADDGEIEFLHEREAKEILAEKQRRRDGSRRRSESALSGGDSM
ncbi:hypothetical protein BU24DRAFT_205296 [Aaosphaeria arxii CBS 175.79]|uniref:Uncharacterized protein n=1 Tax=Aaosphaeria arxii CBS 175.79 TaxID=1450172 RepID=A0A6A5XUG1_9PLEO|nr:uncharacterized protein BU24DRAFT_205296 [Aaosphaeria arxii CBS 175.79]KAF2016569.1 hypothetical protein BU24DRAFT_205296 [Aaosphaeria arxii CBS 175.79]